MEKKLIERKGQVEHVWQVRIRLNGFETCIMVRGTERELRDYIDSEINHGKVVWYCGATDAEVEAANALRIPIYIAPQL